MRIDKFLKINGIIKRRVIAKQAIEKGYVFRNKIRAKASSEVEPGDLVSVNFFNRVLIVRVKEGFESEIVEETRVESPRS
ncbi:MAG: RNA-binding S4 domain-containing protein [Kosmotogaceae bacterium]|nr:RNA-binding S4 domain-containing protein [Kosmotogaceae bacterium]